MSKPRLLLHSCCAVCSTSVLERTVVDYDVTLFFFNPNITPEEEYQKRLGEQRRFLSQAHGGIDLIEGEYSPELFNAAVKGLERLPEGSTRCFKCYEFRLRETAKAAKRGGYDFFSTTLTVSPRKNAAKINEISAVIAKGQGVNAVYADFKKKDGYGRSVELSKQYGLYRQKYCGCQKLPTDSKEGL